jgi:hypothetical protein
MCKPQTGVVTYKQPALTRCCRLDLCINGGVPLLGDAVEADLQGQSMSLRIWNNANVKQRDGGHAGW